MHLEKTMITADLLRRLRNDLPMPVTIAALGREGPPSKMSEGYFRFLCPALRRNAAPPSTHATTSPTASAARKTSTTSTCSSPSTTTSAPPSRLLERWLNEYAAKQAK